MGSPQAHAESHHATRVVKIDASRMGQFVFQDPKRTFLDDWELRPSDDSTDNSKLREAASLLRYTDTPVAFPTETVYGLGADALRSAAVRGIFRAKQRPSDNPLIVHISSIRQLRILLDPDYTAYSAVDPVPPIYHPLIERFWPGPLTILLPLPNPSPFASEVNASLLTVGVRMPSSRLALALIHEAGVPLAAPSANASTKPSPTTAAHVLHDLDGRIDLIIDGGPCSVGVESTVVDGLVTPPSVLRPGGVSIEMLKQCPGWEHVHVGYQDRPQIGEQPKAPGMKYKHYSPKARVMLYEGSMDLTTMRRLCGEEGAVGLVTTSNKRGLDPQGLLEDSSASDPVHNGASVDGDSSIARCRSIHLHKESEVSTLLWSIKLGPSIEDVARGLFAALRALDGTGVGIILVQSVDESKGDTATAVMNRLRKAAEDEMTIE